MVSKGYSASDFDIELPEDDDAAKKVHDALAERVVALFRQAKQARGAHQVMGHSVEWWLGRLNRAYNKVHEAEEVAERPEMSSYYGLIAQKVNMTASFVRSKYVAFKSFPFSLEPTPIVELPESKREVGLQIVRGRLLMQLAQNGGIPPEYLMNGGALLPSVARFIENEAKSAKEQLRDEEMKIARQAAKNMTKLIQDQLAEGGFEEAMSELVFYLSLYPAAFFSLEFEAVDDYKWRGNQFVKEQVIRPAFRAIDPRNAYPASDASSAQDGAFFIEVVRRSRSQLAAFLGNEDLGYMDDAIVDVLADGDDNWLEFEQGQRSHVLLDDDDTLDVLRCQMQISGEMLLEYGVKLEGSDEENRFEYFNAEVEVCNHRVIRVVLVQSAHGSRTYFSASYKRVSNSAWGISPAMMIYDRQLSVNRVQWAMGCNVAFAAGPMVEVNAHHFDHPEDVRMRPFERVFSNPEKANAGGGIAFHQVQMSFGVLFNQMVNEIRLADDECGLPSFLNGSSGLQGAGQTLGGLAMMQDNAVLGMKDCFSIIDLWIIRPLVKALRDINLIDEDDPSIKGDSEVVATGLLGLEKDLEKAKVMAGAAPSMAAFTQQGVVPPDMYRDYVRDLLQSQGLDTSKYMADDVMSGALGQMNAVYTPSETSRLDGRSPVGAVVG